MNSSIYLRNTIKLLQASASFRNYTKYDGYTGEIINPPSSVKLDIPPYPEKQDELIETKRARLLYQSRKRGMLENDLLLSTFAAKHLSSMTQHQLDLYDHMINQPSSDWDLYYWATDTQPTPSEFDNEIMQLFKQHVKNIHREQRIRQPDL